MHIDNKSLSIFLFDLPQFHKETKMLHAGGYMPAGTLLIRVIVKRSKPLLFEMHVSVESLHLSKYVARVWSGLNCNIQCYVTYPNPQSTSLIVSINIPSTCPRLQTCAELLRIGVLPAHIEPLEDYFYIEKIVKTWRNFDMLIYMTRAFDSYIIVDTWDWTVGFETHGNVAPCVS